MQCTRFLKYSIIFSIFLALSQIAGSVKSQNSEIYVSFPLVDTVYTDSPIIWRIALRNNSGGTLLGHTNGFRIYSNSGIEWPLPTIDTLDFSFEPGGGWKKRMDGIVSMYSAVTGSGSDTLGIGSFNLNGIGFEDGFDRDVLEIRIPFPGIHHKYHGALICLDSSYYWVNEWLWSTTVGEVRPDWSGPHCYTIVYPGPHPPPLCPASLNFDHCSDVAYQFQISSQVDTPAVFFQLISGPGEIDSLTGLWTYSPTINDVGTALSIEVAAIDTTGANFSWYPCTISLNFTNVAPQFSSGCDTLVVLEYSESAVVDFDVGAGDCDTNIFYIGGVNTTPAGSYGIDSATGLFTFSSTYADSGIDYTFLIFVTDGSDADSCEIIVRVNCCDGIRGDYNGDSDDANILDLTFLVDYIFRGSGISGYCPTENDINSDGNSSNILDLTYLVDWIFRAGPAPGPC